jgi:hypothetical protein
VNEEAISPRWVAEPEKLIIIIISNIPSYLAMVTNHSCEEVTADSPFQLTHVD